MSVVKYYLSYVYGNVSFSLLGEENISSPASVLDLFVTDGNKKVIVFPSWQLFIFSQYIFTVCVRFGFPYLGDQSDTFPSLCD